MLIVIALFGYFLLSLFVAFMGASRKFGFWGYFFASLLLTPFLGLLLVISADRRKWKRIA